MLQTCTSILQMLHSCRRMLAVAVWVCVLMLVPPLLLLVSLCRMLRLLLFLPLLSEESLNPFAAWDQDLLPVVVSVLSPVALCCADWASTLLLLLMCVGAHLDVSRITAPLPRIRETSSPKCCDDQTVVGLNCCSKPAVVVHTFVCWHSNLLSPRRLLRTQPCCYLTKRDRARERQKERGNERGKTGNRGKKKKRVRRERQRKRAREENKWKTEGEKEIRQWRQRSQIGKNKCRRRLKHECERREIFR